MGPKKSVANSLSLKRGLAFSLFIHSVLLSLVAYFIYDRVVRPAGEGKYSFVAVSLVNSGSNIMASPSTVIATRLTKGETGKQSPETNTEDGEGGTSETLQQIRGKIERAKYYPLTAKRQNIEGSPVVEFQIQNDGSVQHVQIKQTSGSELLDEAAKKTVEQAQPFPFYPEPVALSIHYDLGED